jgi:hypothetical protein
MRHRISRLYAAGPSYFIMLLIWLQASTAAHAEDLRSTEMPSGPIDSNSAEVTLATEGQVSAMLIDNRCEPALKILVSTAAATRQPHLLIWLCRAYRQCGTPKDTIAACELVLASPRGVFSTEEQEQARRYSEAAEIPARQARREAAWLSSSSIALSKKVARNSGMTALIAGGINASIGVGLLVGSIALLSQNTHCNLFYSAGPNTAGCGNAINGASLLGFGASHLLVGLILLGVGGSTYVQSTN